MSSTESSTRPITPVTTETVIHWPTAPGAPKKPKTKMFEYLRPTSVKLKKEAEKPMKSQEEILNALSRAGVRRPTSTKGKSTEVLYPGPRKLVLSVVDGKTLRIIHNYVPTHHLMRASPKAAAILELRPWIGQYKINGPYNAAAVSSVLHAITLSTPFPITTDLYKNLLTYEAALRLGITPSEPILKPLLTAVNALISRTADIKPVLGFIELHLGPKDPVFKHTANVLCYQRFKGEVEDVKAFDRMVSKRPRLQRAMVKIDCAHKENRKNRKLLPEASEEKNNSGEKVAGGWWQ